MNTLMGFLPIVLLFGGFWLLLRLAKKKGWDMGNDAESGRKNHKWIVGIDGKVGLDSSDSSVW